jgi:hypothetical protein
MSLTKNILSASFAAVVFAAVVPAQTVTLYSPTIDRSYGDSDAGVVVHTDAALSASFSSQTKTSGSGQYVRIWREDSLMGYGRGNAWADLRFLGARQRAGDFRLVALAAATIERHPSTGAIQNSSCNQYGSVYLKIGSTVLWDWTLGATFAANSDYRLRLAAPSLVVPVGAGLAVLNGNLYGRIRASLSASFTPCSGRIWVNGFAAASGDASASATVISLLLFADFEGTFGCSEQKIEFNGFTVQPGLNASTTWGRGGSVWFRSGSMVGHVEVDAMLPPFIPISTTLANWSKSYQATRLL